MTRVLFIILTTLCFTTVAWCDESPEKILKGMKCNFCHRLNADDSDDMRKAPDLFFAGNKFKKDWLVNYLQFPEPIREAGYILDPGFLKGVPEAIPHQSLMEADAKQAADALMQLKLDDFKSGVLPDTDMSKGERFKMKMLFERDYGCIACHKSVNLANQPRGGISGPSLLDAGNRLQPDWVYHWLKTPERFETKGRMPRFDLEEEQLVGLSKYVLSHHRKKKP